MNVDSEHVLVGALAQEIRRVDGRHDLGAGALAEALMPFISTLAPNPLAAKGREVPKITQAMVEAFYQETEVTREGSIRRIEDGLRAVIGLAVPSPHPASAVREALKPFSDMAGELFARNFNDSDQVVSIWADGKSLTMTAGQFFALRRVLASEPAPAGEVAKPPECTLPLRINAKTPSVIICANGDRISIQWREQREGRPDLNEYERAEAMAAFLVQAANAYANVFQQGGE